jgi:titin
VNVAGSSAYSTRSAAATPRAVAGTPTDIVGTVGNRQVVLTWTAPANNGAAITDYVVQSCIGSSCSTFAHSPSATAGITVTGLTNGTIYTFKIAAVNLAGTGTAATSSAFTPRTVPNAPTSVRAVADNTTGVDVSWTAPAFNGGSAITDYVVEYATANTDYVVFADGVSTGTSVKVTGLTQGVEYTFRVAARNIAGQGDYSDNSDLAKAVARTVPGRPTATATPTTDGSIELQWKFIAPELDGGLTAEDAIRYDVEYALKDSSVWKKLAPVDNATVRVDQENENLEFGRPYKFRTTASNAAGKGPYSQVVEATPVVKPLSVRELVYGLTGPIGNQTLRLSWIEPVDINRGAAPMRFYRIGFWSPDFVDRTGAPTSRGKNKASVSSTSSGLATTYSFPIAPGTWTFYVTAQNTVGLEKCPGGDENRCGTSVTVNVESPDDDSDESD